jgi:phenylacetate-CoA ligase
VRGCSDVAEYRVQLDCRRALTELTLDVEPVREAADPENLTRRLEEAFQATLNLRVPVRLLPAGSLPRYEMKAQRWVRAGD